MAKVYFYYSSMNAGKSTLLIQAAHNYEERGMKVLILKPAIDTREGTAVIASRIGLTKPCFLFDEHRNVFGCAEQAKQVNEKVSCVLIDEAQFMTPEQVQQAARVADELDIPVLCYGLRTDFLGQLFPGSAALLGVADKLVELKTVCFCGSKATHVLRVDNKGDVVTEGGQVVIGGNDAYVSTCRKHHIQGITTGKVPSHD